MSSYRLTRRADQDLVDIYLYTLETFGLQQAERYVEGVRSCFGLLADAPQIGRKADIIRSGVRRHEHGGHVILYREEVERGGVLILAVIHARMVPTLGLHDLA
ncbi:type II toxin-antitoxin system RelE/ParE family toxin [Lichenihabitans sp. Uapishka_5]|uniref:type II toxin-antitoxin system RelE/ParE family toxin n=1 Tax=Lichenihabitans sp. Uapishka_5 TaxID=3037302 RepID=UPI0029E802E6|nr:type II toxin-antitoxin system RelE/ParE family toxin [Lichenihabitans sp. Uapishka_5]MDX7951795.1 type II toxin-antitoxin system RelE/ParE family toxin [Lichenihabitans sp. Uapishka_5]